MAVPTFSKHCTTVDETKCKTIFKNSFSTAMETQCTPTFDTSCDSTLNTAYKQDCKTIVDVECRIVNLEDGSGGHYSRISNALTVSQGHPLYCRQKAL